MLINVTSESLGYFLVFISFGDRVFSRSGRGKDCASKSVGRWGQPPMAMHLGNRLRHVRHVVHTGAGEGSHAVRVQRVDGATREMQHRAPNSADSRANRRRQLFVLSETSGSRFQAHAVWL